MKKLLYFTALMFIFTFGCTNNPKEVFPVLKGDFLGQQVPDDLPVIFAPGIISTERYERDLAITPDGNEIYYSLFLGTWNTIMMTRRVDGVWQEPVVAEFARDTLRFFAEPSLSADGNKMFYLSARQDWKEQDIWVAERQADGKWKAGIKLPENINLHSEFYPSLTNNGTMYFCRTDEKTGITQVLRSKLIDGVYTDPEVLPSPINGKGIHYNACISRNDSYMIGCVAGRDSMNPRKATYMLFFHNPDDTWCEGIDLIKELNLPCKNAISASVTPDGKYLFFSTTEKRIFLKDVVSEWRLSQLKNMGNGNSDIYWMRFDGVVRHLKK
jgi:hypothetical protein